MLATLVCYFILAIGVPMPQAAKRTSERFPCEHSACGCTTADQCWKHCCCNTPQQRLAWAKREGITPPQYFLDQFKKQAESASSPCKAKPKSSCCCSCKQPDTQVDKEESKVSDVIAWRALACQGKLAWLLAPPPSLTCSDAEFLALAPRIAWLGPIESDRASLSSHLPDVPPPELAWI